MRIYLGLFDIDRVKYVIIWGQFITGTPFQKISEKSQKVL
jgi:hypothetical protein